jgi:glycosyltransferase involved in cell wall biosynthesis/predicted metal-dependent phosphoesterase TrpH
MTLKVGILTPFLWTTPSGVNRQVESLVDRLTARGHHVTVIAPSADRQAVEEARRRVQAVLTGERETVFLPGEPFPRYFFAGATYAVRESRSLKLIAAPADLIANIDVLLEAEDLDLLHLHEPFVPGLGWTALRHASCPLVATFHANPERTAPFLATRPRLRRLFDSLDAAIASSAATRDAAALTFPGAYRVIPPGVDLRLFEGDGRRTGAADSGAGAAPARPLRLLFAGVESRRKGLAVLLRALRLLEDRAGELTLEVCGADRQERRYARLIPPAFAGRVAFMGRVPDADMPAVYRRADVLCAPSLGPETAGVSLLEAMAGGAVVVASRLPGYDEVVRHDVNGLLVAPRRPRLLAAALRRLLDEPALAPRLATAASLAARRYDWDRIAGETEEVYEEVAGRRRQPLPRRRRQQRELFADFHVHSHHSKDCVMPVADILERAREVGLDVIAITDHDSAAGGLEAREIADRYGVRVIVGEEVKSSEGEVIGLFLERTIPGGMTFAETLAAIREQGGVVYVPHPFDRLHTIPAPQVLRANVADIDVLEVFNSRLAFPGFNELAEQFAQRYRIPAAAGSDSHVLPGIGTAMCGIDDFSGPEDFVAALSEVRIVRRPRSLIYLQSLKFIQTTMGASGRAAGQDDLPA